MPHAFACAADLYRRGQHPRILVSPPDLAKLRKDVLRGHGKKILAHIRRNIAPIVDKTLSCATDADLDRALTPDGSWGDFVNNVGNSIHDMAMTVALGTAPADDKRTMEAIRRLLAAGLRNRKHGFFGYHAYAYDLIADRLAPELRLAYAKANIAQAQQLIAPYEISHYGSAGLNGVLVHMFMALHLVLAVRGDEGADPAVVEPLLARLISMLRASMHTAFNIDGYPEEDVGYGTSVVSSLTKSCHAVSRAGLWDAFNECPRLRLAGRAIMHFVQPWGGQLAATGDFPWASCDHRECLFPRLAKINRDPSLLWMLGAINNDNRSLKPEFAPGQIAQETTLAKGFQVPATADTLTALDCIGKPVHPAKAGVPVAFRDRGRGLVSFRDRWHDDGTLVIFDGGQRSPAAQGHHHMSSGHFSLTAMGDFFGIDLNRYGTEQSEHSLTLVDGKSGRSTNGNWGTLEYTHGQLTRYEPAPLVDWAAADSSLQHDCFWARRSLLFIKPHGKVSSSGAVAPAAGSPPAYVVTIDDINKANDFREFWWTLNTSPENTIALRERSATVTGWRKGNHLDVHFALPAANEFPKPHTLEMAQDEPTTSSHNYIKNPRERAAQYVRPSAMLEGIVFVRPRLVAKVAGYNGRIMAALLPRRKGQKPAQFERIPSLPASLAMRITWEKFEDTVIWAHEHNLLEAGDVRAVGQWCVVRKSRATGRVVAHALGDGVSLRIDGKKIPL
ncbi:MAG: hypothetical protein NTW19_18795 [Planctomycetota bacterium]|nr:hypothetical protein [Planctomycetota bacterium]